MTEQATIPADTPASRGAGEQFPAFESPFLRAPEAARTVFLVTFGAACCPMVAGIVLFGWRAALVAGVAICGCALIERVYYFVSRTPALLGRSHAYLTGILLALTLPAHVPWYVPLVAAAFAIIVGKGVFGGVGHFIWQPALVGRLAVAVLFPVVIASPAPDMPGTGPVLARNHLLTGDVRDYTYAPDLRDWASRAAPPHADALLVRRPSATLKDLSDPGHATFSALAERGAESSSHRPLAVMHLPPLNDMIVGARPGGIGETCIVVIVVAGLYLVYRNYVRLALPLTMIAAAGAVAAVAPIYLVGSRDELVTEFLPLTAEGLDVGLVYVAYQLLSGGLFLAAFFLATEMTSRPVTAGGQAIFAATAGALAMVLKLYFNTPIPAYMAVLAANTMSPAIDRFWRPRVLGQKHFAFLRRRRNKTGG
jgi:electron transport complex protein RnfD